MRKTETISLCNKCQEDIPKGYEIKFPDVDFYRSVKINWHPINTKDKEVFKISRMEAAQER